MSLRRLILFFVAAALLSLGAWAGLRYALEARLTIAAQRDLQTIIDLAAIALVSAAHEAPGTAGPALLSNASPDLQEMRRTLERASDQQLRTIYFFDEGARLLRLGGQASGGAARAGPPPAIVAAALAARQRDSPVNEGTLFRAYAGLQGDEAIGAWRWLPELALGIVAERPNDRFVRPLRWLDGAFIATLLALLSGFLFIAQVGVARLRAAFGLPDIATCGPWVIDRLLGEGSMSNVYLAHHRHLHRQVAVKRLKAQASGDEAVARFTREARLASQLVHPNIVTIHDYGTVSGGGFYYAMEYIHGMTLTELVERHGPLPPARTVRVLRQICAAVGQMHEQQLLHRDIKPDNIMAYENDGDCDLVKLLDFGLIKDLDTDGSRDLTRAVRVLGTPAFMAPERLLDPRLVDKRSDLYGIGCIGFYLLTGRKPFEATRDADLAQQVLHVEAPLASSVAPFPMPAALDRLLAACLSKDLASRPPDAAAFIAALDEIAVQVPWDRAQARLWWTSAFPRAAH